MQQLLLALPVLIFSIVLHEVAHGWMARREGDPTAYMLGRITLNPVPHIDPVGSLLVPIMLALLPGGLMFGWAKPVPVNPRNFRNYKRGDILVSLAGVAVNFALGILFAFVAVGVEWASSAAPGMNATWAILFSMARYGVLINFVLALFNLIPIPPLDGSHVFYYLLPVRLAVKYRQLGQYGMLILFAFLMLGGFNFLVGPVRWLERLAFSFAGLLV